MRDRSHIPALASDCHRPHTTCQARAESGKGAHSHVRTWKTGKGAGALRLSEKPVHRQKYNCTVRGMAGGQRQEMERDEAKARHWALEPS